MQFRHHHIHIFILVGAILTVLILILGNIYLEEVNTRAPATIGVSFSPTYTKELGLNPKEIFTSILNDLNIKSIRLNAYWNEIEAQENNFDFQELDYYINEASKKGVKVYLTVGFKLPRWPECRQPSWLKYNSYNNYNDYTYLRQRQLNMLRVVIEYFEQNPTITAYQIENEPLLDFGICPPVDREFLKEEIMSVRKITKKPIILTDTGELRPWVTPMKLSDIFGTTLYRTVSVPILGASRYPLQPWFYRIKSNLVRKLFAPANKKTIIVELQAEAWSTKPLTQTPVDEQLKVYSLNDFKDTLKYAKRTGFDEIYLWGVEWWYYMAQLGHPEYLEYAKSIF